MKFEKVNNQVFENIELNKLFFTDYLPTLSPQCVKVYLYCLYLNSEEKELTFELLAGDLRMEKNELEDCFVMLQASDLVTVQAGTVIINDLALNELNKSYTLRTAKNPLQSNLLDEKRKEIEPAVREPVFLAQAFFLRLRDRIDRHERRIAEHQVEQARRKHIFPQGVGTDNTRRAGRPGQAQVKPAEAQRGHLGSERLEFDPADILRFRQDTEPAVQDAHGGGEE